MTQKSLEESRGAWQTAPGAVGLLLYQQLQVMEMRGEVRRGYFVQGLPGVQFALPEAVERLREWTKPDAPGVEDLVLLNACDPANLFGRAMPTAPGAGDAALAGETETEEAGKDPARFMRIPANYLVLLRGRPVLLLELGAEQVTVLAGLPEGVVERALRLAVEHVGSGLRVFSLKRWNGEPILERPAAPLLESWASGARRWFIWGGSSLPFQGECAILVIKWWM